MELYLGRELHENYNYKQCCMKGQYLQSPQKESIHFCRAEYSKLRGPDERCVKPTIELAQTGPSPILKFQNEARSRLDQLNGGVSHPLLFL